MSAESSWLELCRVQPRFNKVKGSTPQDGKWFIPVYRLGEDGDLKNEGGVRLSVWALRARSYKTKAEA